MIFGQDASFSDEGFIDRYNSDLANDLGNTASRVVTLSRRAFDGATPPVACDDNPLVAAAGGRSRATGRRWGSWPSSAPWRGCGGCSPRPTSTWSSASRGS